MCTENRAAQDVYRKWTVQDVHRKWDSPGCAQKIGQPMMRTVNEQCQGCWRCPRAVTHSSPVLRRQEGPWPLIPCQQGGLSHENKEMTGCTHAAVQNTSLSCQGRAGAALLELPEVMSPSQVGSSGWFHQFLVVFSPPFFLLFIEKTA